jgi:predicted ArsR family transcriptional regulator
MYLRHNDVVKSMGLARGAAPGDAGRTAEPATAVLPATAMSSRPGSARAEHAPAAPAQGTATEGTATQGTGAQAGNERGTRARIARLILENGPATATGLSARLGLTPAAVRRHLDNLIADDMIEARTARPARARGRGRPARLFAITDAGRSAFEHAYDDLATSALRFLAERAGPDAVAEFARSQIADLETRYREAVGSGSPSERVRALAEALSADGYAASASGAPAAGGGEQLCQHHCPVAHVAAEYPQLCEAETEAFGRLLGTPVQRLATIAHGDGVCTTHVTPPSLLKSHGTAPPHGTATTATTANKSGGISA